MVAARQGARRIITAADARALALGLRPGMAVAQAQAMLRVSVAEADPAADEAGLRRIAAWCLRHITPLAAPCPPDGVMLDVTGCTHLFAKNGEDGEQGLLAHVTEKLAKAGVAARAAIADTPGAAHALARHGATPITIAPPGGARAVLEKLPVAALRLEAAVVHALRNLGFETVGQLMATPRAPLAKRFGAAVLRRLDQALGQAAEPIEPILVPEIPRTRLSFPEPIATPEDLARAIKLLAARLCEKLLHRGLGVLLLDAVFFRVDGVAITLRAGTACANRDAAHLARLLSEKLETVDPGFGIGAIMLAAPRTAPLGARQLASLLHAEDGAADFATLIDTLANRLGPDRVFSVAPVESRVPERSVRRVAPAASAAAWPTMLPRPPRLLWPPQPIEALALLPDHPPKKFTWRRQTHLVRHADGPERIFGEWWKAAAETEALRDYFALEDEQGQRFWVFRDTQMRWFLHGLMG